MNKKPRLLKDHTYLTTMNEKEDIILDNHSPIDRDMISDVARNSNKAIQLLIYVFATKNHFCPLYTKN